MALIVTNGTFNSDLVKFITFCIEHDFVYWVGTVPQNRQQKHNDNSLVLI